MGRVLKAHLRAVQKHRAINACLKRLSTSLARHPSKGGGCRAQEGRKKHAQARITTLFARMAVSGEPPGAQQPHGQPPKAAEAAEPGKQLTLEAAWTAAQHCRGYRTRETGDP
eukprot:363226-Chlamydomonas_euryale.AAC.5